MIQQGLFAFADRRLQSAVRVPAVISMTAVVLFANFLGGCGTIVSSMSDGLSGAILNQEDPELVREALPSYLLLLDSVAQANPDNVGALSAAAQLYTAYGAALIDDPERSAKLTAHAKDYGEQALCASNDDACVLNGIDFDQYEAIIRSTDEDDIQALFSYSLSTLAWIRFNSGNFDALIDLPKMEVSLDHLYGLDPGEYAAATCMYLGILNTLRPPALGGKPELAREWFELGISLSEGKNLGIKVEYARGYARLLYDRELHDRLLNEVMQADVKQPNLTLFNVLAQEQAAALLASADDYF
jgi:hypothetical protein